ncbi:hypothetical protein CR513_54596, partial [Mucuna pruriens]
MGGVLGPLRVKGVRNVRKEGRNSSDSGRNSRSSKSERCGVRDSCEDWETLKNMMRARLYQGTGSIEEYHKEMKMNLLRAQIRESEEVTMA